MALTLVPSTQFDKLSDHRCGRNQGERGGMGSETYDVAIVGAGPAGATAAILLAQKDRSVVLIDRAEFPRAVTCAGWLNTRSAELLDELAVKIKSLKKSAFKDVTFHRADFTQSAKPTFEDTPGYLIDRAQFDHALVKTAVAGGVNLMSGVAANSIRLNESSVTVRLADGHDVQSKLLLLASGHEGPLLGQTGISAGLGESPIWAAQVEAPWPSDSVPKKPSVHLVLGLDNGGSFGLCCLSKERLSVGVHWVGERDGAIPALVLLCRQAAEHGIVALDLSEEARGAALIRSPAAAALDRDTHVGKHTLVIGDAGGFISAASNEGIYPAMWSAQIAADVADKALYSVHSQDELMTFDSQWRIQMADYLRSPHTDIQFLLPLIFSNQPMADRMGAAFFFGENI